MSPPAAHGFGQTAPIVLLILVLGVFVTDFHRAWP